MSYVLLFYDFKDELGKKVETIFFFHVSTPPVAAAYSARPAAHPSRRIVQKHDDGNSNFPH